MSSQFWHLFERELKNRQMCLADEIVGAAHSKSRRLRVFFHDPNHIAHQVQAQGVRKRGTDFVHARTQPDVQQRGCHLRRTGASGAGLFAAAGLPGSADEQGVVEQLAEHHPAGQHAFSGIEDVYQVAQRGDEQYEHALQFVGPLAAQGQHQGNKKHHQRGSRPAQAENRACKSLLRRPGGPGQHAQSARQKGKTAKEYEQAHQACV